MSARASKITGVSIVYSTVCSDADQRKHESSASQARGIHLSPVDSLHIRSVTTKIFPFDDMVMAWHQFGAKTLPESMLIC